MRLKINQSNCLCIIPHFSVIFSFHIVYMPIVYDDTERIIKSILSKTNRRKDCLFSLENVIFIIHCKHICCFVRTEKFDVI